MLHDMLLAAFEAITYAGGRSLRLRRQGSAETAQKNRSRKFGMFGLSTAKSRGFSKWTNQQDWL
jgi:hypothetical protein